MQAAVEARRRNCLRDLLPLAVFGCCQPLPRQLDICTLGFAYEREPAAALLRRGKLYRRASVLIDQSEYRRST